MSLDLFANFERLSNNPFFYRIVSIVPYTFTIKLSDLSIPDVQLNLKYSAKIAINDEPFETFNPDADGNFVKQVTFSTASPCICSIKVNVYPAGAPSTVSAVDIFSINGIFVERFPSAEFIAYPSKFIREATNQIIGLSAFNYYLSPGLYFYGEGHTEIFCLSTRGLSASRSPSGLSSVDVAHWYVGNSANNISSKQSLLPITEISHSASTVSISSVVDDSRSYPISLLVTNEIGLITPVGPIITYSDESGVPAYYPFFTSSIDITGGESKEITKSNIHVRPYPTASLPDIIPAFPSSVITLPFDYSPQTFTGIVDNPGAPALLTETFIGSQWEIETENWSLATNFLTSVYAYQFNLSYDNSGNESYFPVFKVSPLVSTKVTLSSSTFKDVYINLPPYDWKTKRIHIDQQVSTTVRPIPVVRVYTPNYYNIKGRDVAIMAIDTAKPPYQVQSITVQSPHSPDTLVLTTPSFSGTMKFDKIGVAELTLTTVLTSINYSSSISGGLTTTVIEPDMLEIVTSYDDVDDNYFLTKLTPFKLTYNYQPRLSPNEWAIADNVNSIIEKLYKTIDELNHYSNWYEQKSKFYGWLGSHSHYVWQDLECYGATNDITVWSHYECASGQSPVNHTWEYYQCYDPVGRASCIQKYCLEWNWEYRKAGFSETDITWKETKKGAQYEKKWGYEKCNFGLDTSSCIRNDWKLSTIDSTFITSLSVDNSRCIGIDVEYIPSLDQLVIAYPTEIVLVEAGYFTRQITRRHAADQFFPFQNITAVATTSKEKIAVLDNYLSRVSIFDIKNNRFVLFTSWGNAGVALDPMGLRGSMDLHIDKEDFVWIADTGNNCIKKFTVIGKPLLTITHEKLIAPRSVCVDANFNVHCLIDGKVLVFDNKGYFLFEYALPAEVVGVNKINTSYNRVIVYITYSTGVIKYFMNGTIFDYMLSNVKSADGIMQGYQSVFQDKFRNVYVTVGDKIFKVGDLQKHISLKSPMSPELYWSLDKLLVHKEEYIQPWVYLKSFHRLWDNAELIRNSLFYNLEGCKIYTAPTYAKTDIVIGQNEIVTNAVINRITEQLWTNIQSMFKYFTSIC